MPNDVGGIVVALAFAMLLSMTRIGQAVVLLIAVRSSRLTAVFPIVQELTYALLQHCTISCESGGPLLGNNPSSLYRSVNVPRIRQFQLCD